jgi:hypothetical protein
MARWVDQPLSEWPENELLNQLTRLLLRIEDDVEFPIRKIEYRRGCVLRARSVVSELVIRGRQLPFDPGARVKTLAETAREHLLQVEGEEYYGRHD